MAPENVGRVVQIIGPVVDIEFPEGVPAIYNAVRIEDPGGAGGVPRSRSSPRSSSTSARTGCAA